MLFVEKLCIRVQRFKYQFVQLIPMTRKVYLKTVDPHNVSVVFSFSWDIIEALRGIPSRKYNASTKENLISKEDVSLLKQDLPGYEFVEMQAPQKTYHIQVKNTGFKVYPEPKVFNAKMSRLMWLKRPRDGYELYRILRDEGYRVTIEDNLEDETVSLPKHPKLYQFQSDAMEFLRNNDYTGLISLDMGLGKTIVALQSIYELKKSPVLIVAPSSLLYQWKSELEKHFGYNSAKVITAKVKKKDRIEAFNHGDIIITNYELLRTVAIERQFELLILDECQRVKNWKTRTAYSISCLVSKRVIGLSGTPVENNIMELYNITDQIKPAYFGTQRKFYNRYVQDHYGNAFTYKNLDEVYRRLQPLMYRKTKDEVEVQLPKLITKTYEVSLTNKETKAYWDMLRNQENVLGAISNAKVFASSSALRIEDLKASSKEKELLKILGETTGQVIVFSQYKKEITRLEGLMGGLNYYSMCGDTKKRDRDLIIQTWKNDPTGILLMTEIGTHGLNLQTAKTLINMDLPWTYARLQQRYGRIQRIGSEHESNLVINLVSKDTIDDRIQEIILNKKEVAEMSVDGKTQTRIASNFLSDLAGKGITFEEQITEEMMEEIVSEEIA